MNLLGLRQLCIDSMAMSRCSLFVGDSLALFPLLFIPSSGLWGPLVYNFCLMYGFSLLLIKKKKKVLVKPYKEKGKVSKKYSHFLSSVLCFVDMLQI